MAEYKVAEIFTSINGEGRKAGQLAVFVRFAGCNLNCGYCDTKWANEAGTPCQRMSHEDIVQHILKSGIINVTLTGGEPLLQPDIRVLLERLTLEELEIEIETNGSIPIQQYDDIRDHLCMTLDYKLPSSGMEENMCLDNFRHLFPQDTVKFVCGSKEDLERAVQIIEQFGLIKICAVYISPVYGKIKAEEIVEFMKKRQLNGVNLQLQLHKFIWDPQKRGV